MRRMRQEKQLSLVEAGDTDRRDLRDKRKEENGSYTITDRRDGRFMRDRRNTKDKKEARNRRDKIKCWTAFPILKMFLKI